MKRTRSLWMVMAIVFAVTFFGVSASSLFAQEREQTQAGRGSESNKKLAALPQENIQASISENQTATEPQKAERSGTEARAGEDEIVTKTYTLRYVSFREVADAARLYIYASSGSVNTITVSLPKKNIGDFEALLRKLDVEKKNVMFRVYTIIASRDNPPAVFKRPETTDIDNRDLRSVLDELKGLWKFKHYWVDAPSFLTVRDNSEVNSVKLVSSEFDFGMMLSRVRLVGEEAGNRSITVGEIRLNQVFSGPKGLDTSNLIDTKEVSLKEKGYLVVGVSGLENAPTGLALILIISAEIK